MTSEHQQKARSKVRRKSLIAAGKRGAQVTIERHGLDRFFEGWRRWKLDHPSKPELLVIGLLARLGFREGDYVREYRLGGSLLSLDFYFDGQNKAIEVHTKIHLKWQRQKRRERDVRKRELAEQMDINVLWVKERDLKNAPKLFQKLQRFFALVPATQ